MSTYYKVIDIINSDNFTKYALNGSVGSDDWCGTPIEMPEDWNFKFKGNVLKNIYTHGDGYLGTNKVLDIINLYGKDGKVWIYAAEEGTLFGHNFIKIRWDGYTYWSSTNESYRFICDIIFFDTNDIVIYCHKKQISNKSYFYMASKNIEFTLNTGTLISFIHKDNEGNEFDIKYGEPTFSDLYDKRYLFKDANNNLYTIKDEVLSQLEETTLTAEIFETYGIETLPTDVNLIKNLKNPTVLYWHDSSNDFPDLHITYTALPKPQVIYSENIDMSDSTILGIDHIVCDCDPSCLIAMSFDNGNTWWTYLNGEWFEEQFERTGITKDAVEVISKNAWAQKVVGGTLTSMLKYRFVLSGDNGYINNITTYFINPKE